MATRRNLHQIGLHQAAEAQRALEMTEEDIPLVDKESPLMAVSRALPQGKPLGQSSTIHIASKHRRIDPEEEVDVVGSDLGDEVGFYEGNPDTIMDDEVGDFMDYSAARYVLTSATIKSANSLRSPIAMMASSPSLS